VLNISRTLNFLYICLGQFLTTFCYFGKQIYLLHIVRVISTLCSRPYDNDVSNSDNELVFSFKLHVKCCEAACV